jgi:hypothetical protein
MQTKVFQTTQRWSPRTSHVQNVAAEEAHIKYEESHTTLSQFYNIIILYFFVVFFISFVRKKRLTATQIEEQATFANVDQEKDEEEENE